MTKPPKPQTVALYARYSSDNQREASIDDQLRRCREKAASEGWTVAEVYTDAAISGASMMRDRLQRLMQDARNGRFTLILTEALDRLSRNQADIASIYQNLKFAGVEIETLHEGRINTLHIGLKGTMNALYIEELAQRTHRGLEGRVLEGKSGGGLCYGYRPIRQLLPNGQVERGDREIVAEEAAVIERIFQDYISGLSPSEIAGSLNADGIPGPRGGAWDKSAIHGNPKRGTGILNNELYIGRLIWNRQKFVKDPDTGKRQARPNPPSDWKTAEVPHLRIIEDDLWQAVRDRQASRSINITQKPAWERRKPKFLLTNLVKCGCCGGGFSTISRNHFGCSNARNKGAAYCANRRHLHRDELEGRILTLLGEHLMDPDLVKIFIGEYVTEMNRLTSGATNAQAAKERELAKVIKDQNTLVDALLAGTPPERIKDRMAQLEARQKQLEEELAEGPAPIRKTVHLHPGMGEIYRKRIALMIAGLKEPDTAPEAKEAIRSLIDKIVATPDETPKGLSLDLHGDLAQILRISMTAQGKMGAKMQKPPQMRRFINL